jgi:putative nucleotidyltransferase with HDIG domain
MILPASGECGLAKVAGRDPVIAMALLGATRHRCEDADDGALADLDEAARTLDAADTQRLLESLPLLEVDHDSVWDAGHYWAHSVAVARIAGLIARRMKLDALVPVAMTAGLLHDLGMCVLAQHFPQHLEAMVPCEVDDQGPGDGSGFAGLGAMPGQIGAWLAEHYQLPSIVRDVVREHDGTPATWQALPYKSRVVCMLVQTADRLAHVLYPGEPRFSQLAEIGEAFEAAARNAELQMEELITESHHVMAELVTKMGFEFPGSLKRPYFHGRKPFRQLVYFNPQPSLLDTVRVFCDMRAHELQVYNEVCPELGCGDSPMIVNLVRVGDVGAQLEVLSSMVSAGMTPGRKGVVLTCDTNVRRHRDLLDTSWMVQPLPTRPIRWLDWLSQPLASTATGAVAVG